MGGVDVAHLSVGDEQARHARRARGVSHAVDPRLRRSVAGHVYGTSPFYRDRAVSRSPSRSPGAVLRVAGLEPAIAKGLFGLNEASLPISLYPREHASTPHDP